MNSDESVSTTEEEGPDDRYHGFSLRSVCWGYRDIFEKAIEGLFDEGLIGPGNTKVSRDFFGLLKKADQSCFDHVLKEFLGAMNPRTRWIMELPGIFAEVTTLGRELAESTLCNGMFFFRILGEGGFGDSPKEVRALVNYVRWLRDVDEELTCGFMKGYRKLLERLSDNEIPLYINEGLKLFHRNRGHGIKFMEGATKSSENIIKGITRECRLDDMRGSLASILRALVGYEVEVSDLGKLDSDELIERGSSLVCMYKWVYLPFIMRHFRDVRKNRQWYLLMNIICAGMLSENSFCRIHGHPQYRTCRDLVGHDILTLNLFHLVEYTRVTNSIRQQWPGATRLIEFGIQTEFVEARPRAAANSVLQDCLCTNGGVSPVASIIRHIAGQSVNAFETASLLSDNVARDIDDACPGMRTELLQPVSFLPDFLYAGEVRSPPQNSLIANLKEKARQHRRKAAENDQEDAIIAPNLNRDLHDENNRENSVSGAPHAAFVYDEWCQTENDYYTDYCQLYEIAAPDVWQQSTLNGFDKEIKQVRQAFERLKPDIAKKEKRLPDGDCINTDVLVDYLVQRRIEPCPRVDFYEKPLINKRDFVVLILLDVSGSTGETIGKETILDIEKRAAVIFGEGLDSLGDNFAVCGFSGNGREKCEYFIYKDYSDSWNVHTISRLLTARTRSSTRIGVALRHSGYRMSALENRQRLIILITDGKPTDNDYDPNTRYAQYDVRKACEENRRREINTFAISTTENTRADMEIMFSRQRFVILPDLSQLPRILPQLYVRLTV